MARADSVWAPAVWPTWIGLGLLRLAAWLPYPMLLRLGRLLGRLAERLTKSRARIVERNFELCFPQLSTQERAELRRRHFESVGMGVMEFAMAWWWPDERLLPLAQIDGRENLLEAIAEGRGIIVLSAHTTSLEVGGRVLKSLLPVHAMYRPNENPVLQRFIERNRSRHAAGIISRNEPRRMLRTLKRGGAVWYAPDQNYKGRGHVFSDFFGIPAATNPATARFAAATGAVVLPVVVFRKKEGGYRLLIERMFDDFPCGDGIADADRMNRVVEQWVRAAPAQYNWLHRRFKTRPPGAQAVYP